MYLILYFIHQVCLGVEMCVLVLWHAAFLSTSSDTQNISSSHCSRDIHNPGWPGALSLYSSAYSWILIAVLCVSRTWATTLALNFNFFFFSKVLEVKEEMREKGLCLESHRQSRCVLYPQAVEAIESIFLTSWGMGCAGTYQGGSGHFFKYSFQSWFLRYMLNLRLSYHCQVYINRNVKLSNIFQSCFAFQRIFFALVVRLK